MQSFKQNKFVHFSESCVFKQTLCALLYDAKQATPAFLFIALLPRNAPATHPQEPFQPNWMSACHKKLQQGAHPTQERPPTEVHAGPSYLSQHQKCIYAHRAKIPASRYPCRYSRPAAGPAAAMLRRDNEKIRTTAAFPMTFWSNAASCAASARRPDLIRRKESAGHARAGCVKAAEAARYNPGSMPARLTITCKRTQVLTLAKGVTTASSMACRVSGEMGSGESRR